MIDACANLNTDQNSNCGGAPFFVQRGADEKPISILLRPKWANQVARRFYISFVARLGNSMGHVANIFSVRWGHSIRTGNRGMGGLRCWRGICPEHHPDFCAKPIRVCPHCAKYHLSHFFDFSHTGQIRRFYNRLHASRRSVCGDFNGNPIIAGGIFGYYNPYNTDFGSNRALYDGFSNIFKHTIRFGLGHTGRFLLRCFGIGYRIAVQQLAYYKHTYCQHCNRRRLKRRWDGYRSKFNQRVGGLMFANYLTFNGGQGRGF